MLKAIPTVLLSLLVATLLYGDPVIDAKRKAASDLFRDGKFIEAITVAKEVVQTDPSNFRDHLLLARAYDRLNKGAEATAEYEATLAALSATPSAEERMARAEAEKRLKTLDQITSKVRAACADFLKKMDVLEKEATAANDEAALLRVLKVKAGIYQAMGSKDAGGFEVAIKLGHQETPFVLEAGRSYRFRAAGTFNMKGQRCNAGGIAEMAADKVSPVGCLLGFVRREGFQYFVIGTGGIIVPTHSGTLNLFLNASNDAERKTSSGSIYVLVEPVR